MLENLFARFQDKELETQKTPLSHVKQKLVQAIFKTVVNSIILKDIIIFFEKFILTILKLFLPFFDIFKQKTLYG